MTYSDCLICNTTHTDPNGCICLKCCQRLCIPCYAAYNNRSVCPFCKQSDMSFTGNGETTFNRLINKVHSDNYELVIKNWADLKELVDKVTTLGLAKFHTLDNMDGYCFVDDGDDMDDNLKSIKWIIQWVDVNYETFANDIGPQIKDALSEDGNMPARFIKYMDTADDLIGVIYGALLFMEMELEVADMPPLVPNMECQEYKDLISQKIDLQEQVDAMIERINRETDTCVTDSDLVDKFHTISGTINYYLTKDWNSPCYDYCGFALDNSYDKHVEDVNNIEEALNDLNDVYLLIKEHKDRPSSSEWFGLSEAVCDDLSDIDTEDDLMVIHGDHSTEFGIDDI